jgi:hypothetical protein
MEKNYIYVKKLPNGLLYLGKTKQNPYKYIGSGKIWLRTIKKYGYTIKDVQTYVIHETYDAKDLRDTGLYYSKLFNVVNNSNWANIIEEIGTGGATRTGKIFGENNPTKNPTVAKKISDSLKGILKTEEHKKALRGKRDRMKGQNNPMYGNGMKGENNPMYGKKHSQETKNKIREIKNNMPIVECPYCNKKGKGGIMKKWHFDNCKK